MTRAFVGLGSNLGNRRRHLDLAIAAIREFPETHLVNVSSVYDTDPVGDPGLANFLNAVVEIQTTLGPHRLLRALQKVERELGRDKKERSGERTVDLDILYYGQDVVADADLSVPRSSNAERLFVLVPMTELDPEWVDPLSGRKVGALLREKGKQDSVRWVGRPEQETCKTSSS